MAWLGVYTQKNWAIVKDHGKLTTRCQTVQSSVLAFIGVCTQCIMIMPQFPVGLLPPQVGVVCYLCCVWCDVFCVGAVEVGLSVVGWCEWVVV